MEFFKTALVKLEPNTKIEGNIIKDVIMADSGKTKDTRYLSEEFIESLVEEGNQQSVGVKARFGHPSMCETTLGTYIGRYKNFRLIDLDTGKRAIADLELDEVAKKSPKGDLYSYILEMAETNPDQFGNSIEIDVEEWEEIEVDGENYDSPKLKAFMSSALVDTPTATGSLFSEEDLGMKLTQFLDENPEIFEVLQDDKLIDAFITNYKKFSLTKKGVNMNLFDKIKKKLKGTFEVSLTDADGELIIVNTDAEDVAVDDEVSKDGTPLATGEYLLADGRTLVVTDGKVTEIKPKVEEEMSEEDKEVTEKEVKEEFGKLFDEKSIGLNQRLGEAFSKIEDLSKSIDYIADNLSSSFEIKKKNDGNDENKRFLKIEKKGE